MGNNPYISVIITAYNRKEFLLDAFNSALNQTLDRSKYEIIVTKTLLMIKLIITLKKTVENLYFLKRAELESVLQMP